MIAAEMIQVALMPTSCPKTPCAAPPPAFLVASWIASCCADARHAMHDAADRTQQVGGQDDKMLKSNMIFGICEALCDGSSGELESSLLK